MYGAITGSGSSLVLVLIVRGSCSRLAVAAAIMAGIIYAFSSDRNLLPAMVPGLRLQASKAV